MEPLVLQKKYIVSLKHLEIKGRNSFIFHNECFRLGNFRFNEDDRQLIIYIFFIDIATTNRDSTFNSHRITKLAQLNDTLSRTVALTLHLRLFIQNKNDRTFFGTINLLEQKLFIVCAQIKIIWFGNEKKKKNVDTMLMTESNRIWCKKNQFNCPIFYIKIEFYCVVHVLFSYPLFRHPF